MISLLEVFFWSSLFLLIFIFFLYPITIYLLGKISPQKVQKGRMEPTISLIVAAYNEEDVISKKIENSYLLDYPSHKLEVIVVSDGSTDSTNRIIEQHEDREGLKGIILNENRGKTTAINTAVSEAEGEILVFTDANVWLEEDALKHLVANFSDESVGCVCGQLNYYNANDSETANTGGLYWHYEEFIKRCESLTGSTMGADGSIFAIRKSLFNTLEPYLIDDFSTSMGTLFQGFRIVFEPLAKAYEKHTTILKEEIRRRRRIANRVYTAIIFYKDKLLQMQPLSLYKFFMHKFARYWAGLLLILTYFCNSLLLVKSDLYLMLWILQTGFYLVVGIGYLLEKYQKQVKLFYIPYYFFIMNWMQLMGVFDAIRGNRQVTWNTKNTSRN